MSTNPLSDVKIKEIRQNYESVIRDLNTSITKWDQVPEQSKYRSCQKKLV